MINIKSRLSSGKNLVYLFIFLNIVFRIPSMNNSIPPYFFFCDEGMYINETFRMLKENNYFQEMFKSGPINIYPVLILYKIYILLFDKTLDFTELLIFGRLILPIIFSALTIIFLDKLVKLIFSNSFLARFIAASLFTFSPYIFGQSRIWYPDHYQFLATTALAYYLLKLFYSELNFKSFLPVALSFSVLVSIKYSGLILGLPIFVVILIKNIDNYKNYNLSFVIKNNLIYLVSGFAILLIINFSAIVNFDKFLEGFNFNLHNYGGGYKPGWRAFNGFKYYSIFLYLVPTSIFSLPYLLLGLNKIIKEKKYIELLLFFITPGIICIYLGGLYLIMNRNINFLFTLVLIPVIYGLVESFKVKNNLLNTINKLTIGIFTSFLIISFSITLIDDFKVDSRIRAKNWIFENINEQPNEIFGINEGCSGSSPLEGLYTTENDREMNNSYKYYVFNDYWDNTLTNGSKRNNIFLLSNHKNSHFYFYMKLDLFETPLNSNLNKLSIKEGYSLLNSFSGNGPTIFVLKKN